MQESAAGTTDAQAEVAEKSRADAHPDQAFGSDPLAVRESDHYAEEYNEGFVDKWDELIDWKGRYESEGSFFVDLLRKHGVESVLDAATGTGFHSVRMLQAGFDTTSVDGASEMLVKAFENGKEYGDYVLKVVHSDWRWLSKDVQGKYDAIVCLGNSFTHLFDENDRRKALAEFYAVLKHDGILIIDQRNYDSILDDGFSSKHTYYYCGDQVSAEPEYVDDGLARFRYEFPDGSLYHLNMFPLRKNYLRRLLREVGFQQVDTYGDFQEAYGNDNEPDFFVHVATKEYLENAMTENYSSAVNTAREYYNSEDADNFYYNIWGGTDIHVGLYQSETEEIAAASRRTVEQMANKLELKKGQKVLDLGAGYGGAARYLAETYGVHVTCLNLSEVENDRNRQFNKDAGLAELIDVVDGDFENLGFNDNEFDVIWSQDAILHSGDRVRVVEEAVRVLKPNGQMVFTDPMAADDCDTTSLQPILDRLHLDSLGSPGFYKKELTRLGMKSVAFDEHTHQLSNHYGRVLAELEKRESELTNTISQDYRDRMKLGLKNWVAGGKSGNLAWGIFHVTA